MKEVDLVEPTSFLDHFCLGCTRRECQISKDIVDNCRSMFESRICAQAKDKLPCSGNPDADISSWSDDVSCKEMCEAILRAGEQNNPATVQSYNSMP